MIVCHKCALSNRNGINSISCYWFSSLKFMRFPFTLSVMLSVYVQTKSKANKKHRKLFSLSFLQLLFFSHWLNDLIWPSLIGWILRVSLGQFLAQSVSLVRFLAQSSNATNGRGLNAEKGINRRLFCVFICFGCCASIKIKMGSFFFWIKGFS